MPHSLDTATVVGGATIETTVAHKSMVVPQQRGWCLINAFHNSLLLVQNGTHQDVDTLDEDEEDFEYEAVDIPEDSDEDEEAPEENFQDALRTVKLHEELNAPPEVQPVVTKLPEVVDDFVRYGIGNIVAIGVYPPRIE